MGFIETIEGPARNDTAAQTRFLAIMREQARRMSRLIDDLLSLSRIELKEHVQATEDGLLISLTDRENFSMFAIGSAEPQPRVLRMMDTIAASLGDYN